MQTLITRFGFVVFLALAIPSTGVGQNLNDQLKSESLSKLAMDAVETGDPVRGALAFYTPTMNCAKCHETSKGRRLGPDLAEKRDVKTEHLVNSILHPSAEIKEGYQTTLVQLEDGRLLSGIQIGETDSHLMLDGIEQAGEPLKISKDEIEDSKKTTTSTMPEDLANQLTGRQQFLDLIAYLAEIAKEGPGRALALKPAAAMFTQVPLPEYESRVDHAGLIRDWDNVAYNRGEEIYKLRCASCHGTLEEEGSMPTSLRFASGKFKHGNDPHTMYKTLTHGFGMMNAQRWMVPQQKYAVIYYIRKHFLEPKNPEQLFSVSDSYLANLPKGDTFGPKPVLPKPWSAMNYGPSWFNTIEVSKDGANIAQKGFTVRLDNGPGGVESGKYWMMYDHDTMRVAAAWSGDFIDYNGIHFNGMHGRHPKLMGNIHFQNPEGPGSAKPGTDSFEDTRLVGRNGRRYGPIDRTWAQYKGMYRFGNLSVLKYRLGETDVLESPGLSFVDNHPVFTRTLNLEPHDQPITLQLAQTNSEFDVQAASRSISVLPKELSDPSTESSETVALNGSMFGQVAGEDFDWNDQDFTILADIKTSSDGTLLSNTVDEAEWVADGKTLFLQGGRLTLDIGWVGAVRGKKKVDDGKWHQVAMTYRARDGQVRFYVDGKLDAKRKLKGKRRLENSVVRIGFTNSNFPGKPFFEGELNHVRFLQRLVSPQEIAGEQEMENTRTVAHWKGVSGMTVTDVSESNQAQPKNAQIKGELDADLAASGVVATVDSNGTIPKLFSNEGNLRVVIPPSTKRTEVTIHISDANDGQAAIALTEKMLALSGMGDLHRYTNGGPGIYPELLETETIMGADENGFAVDVFVRPKNNPWQCQMRLTGIDFNPAGDTAVVSTWDGSVFKVSGLLKSKTQWKRIAAGMFQPLGIKWIGDRIFVTCRDQLCCLHDLNGDEEVDFYECFNNDHQVTEHFHEFAMGLQTDDEGNFYYAKSARHALKAVVPHHGTLLKVSADGETTEIVANGFRAANGVCINPDGSFLVTDQEGHWNPKNRINWVEPGGFYGNMFGYHDVTDDSDEAMDPPLCWITNSFDRSPAELVWVDSSKWGELDGRLLNFSYGFGKVYIVPHEKIGDQVQGGMCAFDIPQFPTGVMRGRFNSADGQLYCCGMFAWSSSQQQPGGFYRIRRTESPLHLPIELNASNDQIRIKFSGELDVKAAADPKNWAITTWSLKRTANYGSKHFDIKELEIDRIDLNEQANVVELSIPNLEPTWCMEINYSIKTADGKQLENRIHNTIHQLGR